MSNPAGTDDARSGTVHRVLRQMREAIDTGGSGDSGPASDVQGT